MDEELQDAADGVPWRIEHREGSIWELFNLSDRPKYTVEITGTQIVKKRTRMPFERIDGRSSETFWCHTSMQTASDPSVVVTWHRRQDDQCEPKSWKGTIPPKR